MNKPVLVVMAAGMGSRYGGLKQIDPVGSQGEAILDYSLYDAWRAGFETAVIIIKEAIREDFMATVGKRLEKCPLEIRYAYQELSMLPENYALPAGRVKPWGTCHAVLCAQQAIGNAPFAVLNSDDYYGASAFQTIYDYLSQNPDNCCMVGYQVGNTVTDHGGVTRGICQSDDRDFLTAIVETKNIEKTPWGIRMPQGDGWQSLDPQTLVSMNFFGFPESFLNRLERHFPGFLDQALAEDPQTAEFLLPTFVGQLIREEDLKLKVLSSPDKWFGVTYAADKPQVVQSLRELTAQGKYPDGLWG